MTPRSPFFLRAGAALAGVVVFLAARPASAELPATPPAPPPEGKSVLPSPAPPPEGKSAPRSPAPGLRLIPREITPERTWDPRWPRFRTAELLATGIMAAGIVPFVVLPPSSTPWTGRNTFDESARDALRLPTERARNAARDVSDLLLSVNSTFPFFVDALASAYWLRKSRDVAFQMVEIDAEVMMVTVLLQSATSALSSRERPYGRLCPADSNAQNRDCFSNNRYHSFFSGHSSTAFAGAGLICSHHLHLSLWGGGLPDILACVGGFASAATTAYLRVAADQHYLSDVLTGAAIGTVASLGLPWLLHYRGGASTSARTTGAPASSVSWTFSPTPFGGAVLGTF